MLEGDRNMFEIKKEKNEILFDNFLHKNIAVITL